MCSLSRAALGYGANHGAIHRRWNHMLDVERNPWSAYLKCPRD